MSKADAPVESLDRITPEQRSIIERLYDINALKFGEFTLKSGIKSPVYIDLRLTISHPQLLRDISSALSKKIEHIPHDLLCGVPYTAIPFATAMALSSAKPMLMRRKEAKAHGTKRLIEGQYTAGQSVLIVEDLVTSGLSVLETVGPLRDLKLETNHVVVVLDRQQGAASNLASHDITVHSVFNISDMLAVLLDAGKIDVSTRDSVLTFVAENQVSNGNNTQNTTTTDAATTNTTDEKKKEEEEKQQPENGSTKPVAVSSILPSTYGERATRVKHPVAKRLLELMESKRSNLAIAADVTTASALLELAESTGPHIVLFKTHADIVSDWNDATGAALRDLASRHNFLIFEDRKFADIGNTAYHQVSAGVHRIASWADVVNAHAVAGDGVIAGLSKAADQADEHNWRRFGILMLAQMSSKGNLASGLKGYTERTVDMAQRNSQNVFGFISMEKISSDEFLYLTPGVSMQDSGDNLGQQYCTPEAVISERGSDVIIVGRGVYQAENKAAAAQKYRQAGWKAYEKRISGIN